jgi:phosphohistidine phosphatase
MMSNKETDAGRAPLPAEYEFYIMRHGLAETREVTTVLDDAKRPLTPEGREKLRVIASGLAKVGMEVDWIVSSPLVRAVQTAEIVADELDSNPPLDLCDALKPGGSPEALITFLAKRANRRRVLVVGHEPDLGELAARLIGAGRNANVPFKKGGCCLIEFSIFPPKSPGRLVWWLPPRVARKLA